MKRFFLTAIFILSLFVAHSANAISQQEQQLNDRINQYKQNFNNQCLSQTNASCTANVADDYDWCKIYATSSTSTKGGDFWTKTITYTRWYAQCYMKCELQCVSVGRQPPPNSWVTWCNRGSIYTHTAQLHVLLKDTNGNDLLGVPVTFYTQKTSPIKYSYDRMFLPQNFPAPGANSMYAPQPPVKPFAFQPELYHVPCDQTPAILPEPIFSDSAGPWETKHKDWDVYQGNMTGGWVPLNAYDAGMGYFASVDPLYVEITMPYGYSFSSVRGAFEEPPTSVVPNGCFTDSNGKYQCMVKVSGSVDGDANFIEVTLNPPAPTGWHDLVDGSIPNNDWTQVYNSSDLTAQGYDTSKNEHSCEVDLGWACDPDDFGKQSKIHLYSTDVNQELDISRENLSISVVANLARHGFGFETACGGTLNHGYAFTIPPELKDDKDHWIWAYAFTNSDVPYLLDTGTNPKSRKIHCSVTPPSPPPCSLKANHPTVLQGESAELTWTGTVGNRPYHLRLSDNSTIQLPDSISSTQGTISVTPSRTTTYTLYDKNDVLVDSGCPTLVTVTSHQSGGDSPVPPN